MHIKILSIITAICSLWLSASAQAEYKCNLKHSMGVHTADMRPTKFVLEDEEYRVISFTEMWERYEAGVFKKEVDQFIKDDIFYGEAGFFQQRFPGFTRSELDGTFYYRSTEVPADWWYSWKRLDKRIWPKASNGAITATSKDGGNVFAFSPTTGRLVQLPDPAYAWLTNSTDDMAIKFYECRPYFD